jgi:ABC-2 type transport system permease protein
VLRFWKVSFQTVAAPVLTAVLYLLIFGHVLEDHVKVYDRISYTAFSGARPGDDERAAKRLCQQLIEPGAEQDHGQPGVFAAHATVALGWFVAYVGSSVVRGLAVGLGCSLSRPGLRALQFAAPLWIVVFAVLGAALLATLGLIAGLWADKFDQMAAFQNFVIVPMTFLSGVFYSIQSLPPFWQGVSHLNPFFYMIDGFRYGFFGQSDTSPWLSLGIVGRRLAGRERAGRAPAAHRLQDPL